MENNIIPYTPSVLKWARESAGITLDDVAKKLNKSPEVIIKWESGESSPTYVQLERMAYELYKRPIALFFFPKPPNEISPKESFRTLPEYEIDKMSPKFRYLLRKSHAMQENLRELNNGKNSSYEFILKELRIDKKASIESIANILRHYLGISLSTQKSWKNDDIAFKKWRSALEKKGLFIFKDAFKEDAFSGFCIYDKEFPIIFLNNSKSKTRQIFTLFHELAHILFKTGGVDTKLSNYIDYLNDEHKKIEIFCNKFAAYFLVPDDDFNTIIQNKPIDEKTFSSIAKKYSVSREVILRKYLDYGLVSQQLYKQKTFEWAEQAKQAKIMNKEKRNGGSFYNTKSAYLGQYYMGLVFSKYYQKDISINQVSDYLGVKRNQIKKLESIYSNGIDS